LWWWCIGRRWVSAEATMESTMKGIRGDGAPCVLDMDDSATVGGGVEDTYGEDQATEEQLVTPWTVSVAR
jgi:malate dehydrogenase (oxaloacetate-decarboxylating)(NADP+)